MINTGWANYLKKHLARLEWTNAYLADAASLDRSLVGRWIHGEAQPSVDSVRKVCRAIRRDFREGLVESGLMTKAELRYPGDRSKTPLNMFDDDALLADLRRRLYRSPGMTHDVVTVTETQGVDSATWTEQSGPDTHDVPSAKRRRSRSATAAAVSG